MAVEYAVKAVWERIMIETETTLSYQTPRGERSRFAVHYAYLFTTLFIPAVIFGYLFLVKVPQFREIFRDFRTTLPLPTQITFALAAPLAHWWVWLGLTLMVAGLLAPLAHWTSQDRTLSRRRIGRIVSAVVILSLLLLAFLGLSLGPPLVKLMQSIH